MKNGANGIYFSFLISPQAIPNMQENTNAMDKPTVPSHIPPVLKSFMSPMPIGLIVCCGFILLKTNFVRLDSKYPKVAPKTASWTVQIQGKNATNTRPNKANGNK